MHQRLPEPPDPAEQSAAATWAPLRAFIAGEARLGAAFAARGPVAAGVYEFLRFGVKQGWACLFGGIFVGLILATWLWYPRGAALSRYDFLFLAALVIQGALLALRLETFEEAKVIFTYHVVGTVMEIFKTGVGSWIYPEPSFFRIGGVPLFAGFMYACVGSYICRSWRLFHFRFVRHPPLGALGLLSLAIYANFFAHHFLPDMRLVLFAAALVLFGRARLYFLVWHTPRWMPLIVGLSLVAVFIWIAENVGTFTRTWSYPAQREAWVLVGWQKLGSWLLLLIISYTLVAFIKRADIKPPEASATAPPAPPAG
ncbi:DUF817 domain-containing protein [soil metagenome]